MYPRRRLASAVALSTVLSTLIGCGAAGGGGGSGNEAAPAAAGAEAAAALLAEQTENPSSVGPDTPLAQPPEPAKQIINLTIPFPTAKRQSDAMVQAADILGWEYTAIDAGTTPSAAVSAFEAALAREPDAITYGGYPNGLLAEQLRKAKSLGVAVVSNFTGEGTTEGLLAEIGGVDQLAVYGKMASAYVASKAPEGSSVVTVSVSAYPIFEGYIQGFEDGLSEWCPDCKNETLDQQPSDIGTKMPANIVAYLQRHPDVKWVNLANGDFAQGLSGALATAGLKDVQIMGNIPSPANLANLEAGTEAAWVGHSPGILGWREMDVLARHFAGEDISAAAAAPLPTQIITRDNVAEIIAEDGFYMGVDDYAEQFKELWKLG
jgi:ribose transport system substrate-binding protein